MALGLSSQPKGQRDALIGNTIEPSQAAECSSRMFPIDESWNQPP